MTIVPNPGFVLLLGALIAVLSPRAMRAMALTLTALVAAAAPFLPDFGAQGAFAQAGLTVTPLRLDALAQVYGLALGLSAALLALASGVRRDRFEDAALMLHAGGAMTAVFAGDLVSFVAGAAISGLGAVGLTIAGRGPKALAAGLRLLGWMAAASAALIAGAGLALAMRGGIGFDRLGLSEPPGLLVGAGLMILAAGPFAHVWLKDCAPRAGLIGGAALTVFLPATAAYGFARGFAGEPILAAIGAALAAGAAIMAFAAPDPRRGLGYVAIGFSGMAMAGAGLATPLTLAGAAALSFTTTIAMTALMLAVGAASLHVGRGAPYAALGGAARWSPVAAILALISGASLAGMPGLAGYASLSLMLDGTMRTASLWVWLLLASASIGLAAALLARILAGTYFGRPIAAPAEAAEPPFAIQLALILAAFLAVAIGVAPGWLYGLAPGEAFHAPYEWSALISRLQALAGAGLVAALAAAFGLMPRARLAELIDVDWLLRRPGRALAKAIGTALAAGYASWNARAGRLGDGLLSAARKLGAAADRPSRNAAHPTGWLLVAMVLALALVLVRPYLGQH